MHTRNLFIAVAVLSLIAVTLTAKLVMSYLFLGYGLTPWIGIPVVFFCMCFFGIGVQEALNEHYRASRDKVNAGLFALGSQFKDQYDGHFRSELEANHSLQRK